MVQRYELFYFDNEQPLPGSFLFLPSFVNGLLFSFYGGYPPLLSNGQLKNVQVPPENLVSSAIFPTELKGMHRTTSIRVVLQPGALLQLYGKPLNEYTGQSVPLSLTLDKKLLQLWEQIGDSDDPTVQISWIEKHLWQRLGKVKKRRLLYPLLDLHLKTHGYQQGVAKIARKVGVGERDLNRKLNAELGFPMTKFISIHRFNSAMKCLQQAPKLPLTQVAHQFDYSDQPHFNREFKRLSGMTPRQFTKGLRAGQLLLPRLGGEIHSSGALYKRA